MPRVLMLHTGGTLGMSGTPLEPAVWEESVIEQIPELLRIADLDTRVVCNLDSSDIGPRHWGELARMIAEERDNYDGFVILHGTDTMAWTASALSFALRGLNRPVILTGAQRPLKALRTDARRNIADAVEMATRQIPEVAICFDGLLLRGCRARKTHAQDYRAFNSPGCAPIARLGVDAQLGPNMRGVWPHFQLADAFDDRVIIVHATPGLRPERLQRLTDAPNDVRGVVLIAFGAGTVPSADISMERVVEHWIASDVDVLVTTDSSGRVDLSLYRNSRALAAAGAVSAERMTLEAATTKLMHALARFPDDRGARKSYLLEDVAGELG